MRRLQIYTAVALAMAITPLDHGEPQRPDRSAGNPGRRQHIGVGTLLRPCRGAPTLARWQRLHLRHLLGVFQRLQ